MCAIHGLLGLLANGGNLTKTIHGAATFSFSNNQTRYKIIQQATKHRTSRPVKTQSNTVICTLWTVLV
jgi:hypothetical protein